MDERRNAWLSLILALCVLWALCAWVILPETLGTFWHKVAPVAIGAAISIYLFCALSCLGWPDNPPQALTPNPPPPPPL